MRAVITTADGRVLAAKVAARCLPLNSTADIGFALDYPNLLTLYSGGHYGQQLDKAPACELIQTLQYWVATNELPGGAVG
jgi:hypothetical protein